VTSSADGTARTHARAQAVHALVQRRESGLNETHDALIVARWQRAGRKITISTKGPGFALAAAVSNAFSAHKQLAGAPGYALAVPRRAHRDIGVPVLRVARACMGGRATPF
jgi:hypothetical protein